MEETSTGEGDERSGSVSNVTDDDIGVPLEDTGGGIPSWDSSCWYRGLSMPTGMK